MTPILRRLVTWVTGAVFVNREGQRMVLAVASMLEQMGPTWQIDKLEVLPRDGAVRVTLTFRDPAQRYTGDGLYQQVDYVLAPEDDHVKQITEPAYELAVYGAADRVP